MSFSASNDPVAATKSLSLHENLIEHINSEITLETVDSLSAVMHWLRSTFLFIRLQKNPAHYALSGADMRKQSSTEDRLREICSDAIETLVHHSLVDESDEDGTLQSTGQRSDLTCSQSIGLAHRLDQSTGESWPSSTFQTRRSSPSRICPRNPTCALCSRSSRAVANSVAFDSAPAKKRYQLVLPSKIVC